MRVGEACTRDVVIVGKEGSILDAARLMREFHVGDVVVVEERHGRRRPVGILTDRDIVVELIANEVDYGAVAIKDVMSFQLLTATEDEDILVAVERMKSRGVRRLPVVGTQGDLVGILAVADLIDLTTELLSDLVALVSNARKRETVRRRAAG